MSNNLEIRRQIDSVCNQFEEAWSADKRPDFESFLNQVDPEIRESLLRALLEVDVELRAEAGLPIDPNEYRQLGGNAVAIVEELISAAHSPNRGDPTTDAAPIKAASSSKQIGPYKLLQQIGEGGMGTVWMAEQEKPVKRRVALKVIKSGVGSKEVITRFEAERQALSLMNHSNIARILDVGTTADGQPYFAMELVQGQPLTSYCDNNRVGISERLQLFAEVCSGVQHAHQKGIIHRDLKPSNILVAIVDGKPVPKVIDFGLAKALESTQRLTDQSLFTGIGQILGTLKYMSPEQASLDLVDIDTRTDIYSLGVILYELLTGSTPLDNETVRGEAMLKVLQLIRDKEPAKPSSQLTTDKATLSSITNSRRTDSSSLNRILVGDLDWVVVKALEKDRSRRYESASGLAADIQRFLNNEPVTARPPTAVYRIRKFVRKNRAGVTAAALLVTALLAGLAGTTWQMRRAQIAEQDADQAKERAQSNEKSARQQSQLALSTLTSVIDDIQGGLKNLSGGGEIRRRLLKTSLEKLESVATNYIAQAAVDRNTMNALHEMGGVVMQFGIEHEIREGKTAQELNEVEQSAVKVARSFYTRAFEIAQLLAAADPRDARAQHDLSILFDSLGDVQLQSGQITEALGSYQKAFDIRQKLATADLSDVQAQRDLSVSFSKLGDVQLQSGQVTEALGSYQQQQEISQKLAAADPTDARAQRGLFISYEKLGDAQFRLGQLNAAINAYQTSLEISQKLLTNSPNESRAERELAVLYGKLGAAQLEAGHENKALNSHQQRLEISRNLALADPNDIEVQQELSIAYDLLGYSLFRSKNLEEAFVAYQKSHEIREVLAAADPNDAKAQMYFSYSLEKLGDLHLHSGQKEEALRSYTRAFEIIQRLTESDPSDAQAQYSMSVSCEKLGDAHLQFGNLDEASQAFRRSIRIREELLVANSEDSRTQRGITVSYGRLGDVQFNLGQVNDALSSYEKALEFSKKMVAADPTNGSARRDVMAIHYKLGETHKSLGDFEKATTEFETAVANLREMIEDQILVEESQQILPPLKDLAKSTALSKAALGSWVDLLKQPANQLPGLLDLRGTNFANKGRFAEAAQAAAKLRELENASSYQLYNAACVFSLCAASIEPADGQDLSNEQVVERQKWIEDALATLKQSIAAGFDDFDSLRGKTELSVLYDLPEFEALFPKN